MEAIIKNIDAEFESVFESCRRRCAFVIQQYDEETFGYSFLEADETDGEKKEKKPGGIIGLLKGIFDAIIKMLTEAGAKIKSIFSSTKVKEEEKQTKINNRDVDVLAKLVNKDIKDSTDFLARAQKGEVTVDDARKFIDEHDGALETVKSVAIPAVSLFTSCKLNEKFVDVWKSEAKNAFQDLSGDESSKWSEKYANTYGNEDRMRVAKEGARMIAQRLPRVTEYGILNCVMNPIKKMYQMKVLEGEISFEGESMDSKHGWGKVSRAKKKDIRKMDKARKEEEKSYFRRNARAKENEKLNARRAQSQKDLEDTFKRTRNNIQ